MNESLEALSAYIQETFKLTDIVADAIARRAVAELGLRLEYAVGFAGDDLDDQYDQGWDDLADAQGLARIYQANNPSLQLEFRERLVGPWAHVDNPPLEA